MFDKLRKRRIQRNKESIEFLQLKKEYFSDGLYELEQLIKTVQNKKLKEELQEIYDLKYAIIKSAEKEIQHHQENLDMLSR